MSHYFADELNEVQRHQGLLRELQKLAADGTDTFSGSLGAFEIQISSLASCFPLLSSSMDQL